MTFKELGLNDSLLEGLESMGFTKATPIQEKAIPAILSGKDLIACAPTGTGKTAAFLLPVIHNLTDQESRSIDTLIIVPTRELATQIDQQLEGFGYFSGVSSLPIYGGRDGNSFNIEKTALTSGTDVVIATPGRLIAHLNLGYVKLDKLRYFILDEADRMLDMGFVHDIQKIINYLPKQRQNIMFSATMPPKIRQFAKRILKEPEQINFAVSKPAEGILQAAYRVEDEHKVVLVENLLGGKSGQGKRILIFSETKAKVKQITSALKQLGLEVEEIHSDLDQDQRENILRQFKNGNLNILVATDILSRGIDVKGIHLVLNFDVPSDGEDYIHRIGRTARAESDGVAITLINRKDQRKFGNIERLMEMTVHKLPIPTALRGIIPDTPPSAPGQKDRRGRRGSSNNKRRSYSRKGKPPGGRTRRPTSSKQKS